MASPPIAAFCFDLADPLCYVAAERVLHALPGPAEWRPVLARELPGAGAGEMPGGPLHEGFRAEIARRAETFGLQPLRWPEPFPFDSSLAMRVATYARSIGRAVAFAQAAFRQSFAAGRSLQDADSVVIAAAACEMHPAAVLRAAQLRSVADELAAVTAAAAAVGVSELPAVVIGESVFGGEDAIEAAAAHMQRERARGTRG